MRVMETSVIPYFIALVFALAGLVKGVIGLGLPTIAVALLSLAMNPAEAAALLIVPSLVTNLWQSAGPHLAALLKRLWPMFAGIFGGTWIGAGLLAGGSTMAVIAGLGAALVVYAALGLLAARFRVPAHAERWLAPPIGGVTGLVTGATGIFVIPAVPYLQALGLERNALVQALGLSFTVSTVALGAGLLGAGLFDAKAAGASLLALVPALLGMAFGQWLRGRVSERVFRRCFFLGLLALGAHLFLSAIV